ncbi:MAG TPA: restriction endonuclease [Chthoniobacterales bacterium]|nr:restriction endonuclease [Chthoniobacterales bacterium]
MHDIDAEEVFRSRYDRIYEEATNCYNASDPDNPCRGTCRYLIAADTNEWGYPPVMSLGGCDATVVCCGGDDVLNSTVHAYCSECAQRKRAQEEAESLARREAAARDLAAKEQHNRTLRAFWMSLSELEFEYHCAEAFRALGFAARTTPRTNDGGLDVILEKDGRRGAAQCKAWLAPSGVKELREFCGALYAETMSFGYFISRGGFTRRGKLLLPNMSLITGWTLDDLITHSQRKV